MTSPRSFACLWLLAAAPLACAQPTPPTAYTITQALVGGSPGATTTIYRSGSKVLMETIQPVNGSTPASHSLHLLDLATKATLDWDPSANPPACGAGSNSGDWGDPFAMAAELNASITKGELKPAGSETIGGVPTQVYSGSSAQGTMKAWLDTKSGLVMRAIFTSPGAPPMTMIDIRKVSFAAPPAAKFAPPASCAGLKPPPSPTDLIAQETGDDPGNYVNGMYGPGSKNTCSVVLRVVNAQTLAPISHIQVAIDTTYNVDNPPHYDFGVHDDGSQTYAGGHILEITKRAHNGVVRLGNPPDAFMLGVNVIHPGHGGGMGLVYRQCFAPTQVLLYVVKDYGQPTESGDFLWVKSGKNATAPPL